MKTRTVTILTTMLSLTAANLLVAATNDVILLPSDGGGEGLDAGHDVAPEATTRPWKCCDMKVCTKSYPPSCICLDKVEQCDAACARCVLAPESDSATFSRVCKDWYHGDPGPRCTASKDGGDDDEERPAKDAGEERKREDEEDAAAAKERKKEDEEDAAAAAKEREKEDEGPRPWACCNITRCTKSFPPTCTCLDVVEECAAACRRCEPSGLDPSRHVCNDHYHGDPGPACAKDDDHNVPSGASRSLAAAAAQLLQLAFVALLFIHSR